MGGLVEMYHRLMDGVLDDFWRQRLERLHDGARTAVHQVLRPGIAAVPVGAGQPHTGGQAGHVTAARQAGAHN